MLASAQMDYPAAYSLPFPTIVMEFLLSFLQRQFGHTGCADGWEALSGDASSGKKSNFSVLYS